MSELLLLTGLSGAGKTTFAKSFAIANKMRYIGIDDFYAAVFGDINTHSHEFDVWMMFYRAIEIAARDKVDTIIDTNAPTKANREEIYDWFGHMFNDTGLVYIETPPALCIQNNTARERKIPPEELRQMILQYEPPDKTELSKWKMMLHIKNDHNKIFNELQNAEIIRP